MLNSRDSILMSHLRLCLILLVVTVSQNVSGALLNFEFSGRTYDQGSIIDQPVVTGQYEGYFTLDSSVPNGADFPFAATGIYEQSILAGGVTINGATYSLGDSGTNEVAIYGFLTPYDSFTISAALVNEQGDYIEFTLSLVDSSDSIFNDSSFPTYLSLADFDSSDLSPFFGTGASYTTPMTELLTVDYAELRPIPLPASLLFFCSALMGFLNFKKKGRK